MSSHDYLRPTTVSEALELAAAQPEARFIAGGTDILVQLQKRARPVPPALISLRRIEALRRIEVGDVIRIGAAACLTDVMRAPAIVEAFPALVASIAVLGSPQIRNVATLGGNLCNASPAADTAPPLLVHEARVELQSTRARREVPLTDFFTGPGQTVREPGEMMTAILLEPARAGQAVFLRRGRIKMDLAAVSLAVWLERDGDTCVAARIAAGAVAPVPLRLTAAEELLNGASLSTATITAARAAAAQAVAPIDDLRSTADYRRHLVGVYLGRALDSLRQRAAA